MSIWMSIDVDKKTKTVVPVKTLLVFAIILRLCFESIVGNTILSTKL